MEIRSVRFSRGGERLATASADSTVRLYAPMGNPSLSPAASAHVAREPRALDLDSPPQEWRQTLVMMCQVYTPPARPNTRRPRVQATPEVQQIEWALDDRRIMAATSDFTVRVFDTLSGTQLHVLHGHTKALFELSAHPRVPDVVASWAHDGTISVWDVSNGRQLAHFSARNTFPGNGRWCDTEPICFLDGGWTSTGDALMTTDVAGQFHIFAFGPAHLNGRAAYDQFFKNDYEPFAANADGFAVSSASSRLMHLLAPPVCDYNLSPYENPYQDLAMQNKLSQGMHACSRIPLLIRQALHLYSCCIILKSRMPQVLKYETGNVAVALRLFWVHFHHLLQLLNGTFTIATAEMGNLQLTMPCCAIQLHKMNFWTVSELVSRGNHQQTLLSSVSFPR